MGDSGRENKRIVVIGGGVAGSLVAKTLEDNADVVLIDSKDYFEITWASLRSMVEPSFARRSVIRHFEYLSTAQVIASAAVDITDNEVLIEQGHRIPYDYLVIATGHKESGPLSKTEKLNHYQEEYDKIRSAPSILIIGGGPTGVELAGEIAVDFPDKKVTLLHRGSRLLEFIGHRAGRKALGWLTSRKVEVVLGQSIDLKSATDGVYCTSGGETIRADCYFNCTGKPLASLWLKDTILKNSLDVHGRLMVDENLRVKGHNNIFGIGDITDIPEIKQGYLAQRHALLAANNLKSMLTEGKIKMASYKPGPPIAIVSLGRRDAVAQIFCITMIGRIPGIMKSDDLFVGKTRKQLGLKSIID